MKAQIIAKMVLSRVQLFFIVIISSHRQRLTTIQQNIFGDFEDQLQKPFRCKPGVWCKWQSRSPGWFKLKVDRCHKNGVSTGGIIN